MSAVPIAVELGNFDAAVVDNKSAIVVTSRIRVVVTPKTVPSPVLFAAIHPAIPGAIAVATQVTPMTIAIRNRYCGIVGA